MPLVPELKVTDRTCEVGGITIHYVEAGHGPLIVLLHGFPEFWYSWRHQIPALAAAGFHVIAVDLRGYNDSSKPQDIAAYKLAELAKDIAGVITQTGESPCILGGHDWGGGVAWLTAMLYPELVRRLIILNSPHPVAYLRELRHSARQKWRAKYQLFFQPPWFPEFVMRRFRYAFLRRSLSRYGSFTADEIERYVEAWSRPGALTGMANYYRAIRKRKGMRGLMRRIDIPTLMIWGDLDPFFTPETLRDFRDYVPDLQLEHIVDAGHFVQTDAPGRVNELMIGFARSSGLVD
ncbi:MAG: epoxide hydrolase 4 [Thermoanaerobaculia bacterium]|nr:epoxide hydrolase 4 [Thermoanaerobaculia bacterium]